MIPFNKCYPVFVLLAFWLICDVYSAAIDKKLGDLRQKHDYFHKRELFNQTMSAQKRAKTNRHRLLFTNGTGLSGLKNGLLTSSGLSPKENNTKREYVYYPDGGQGHFQGYHDDAGFDNGADCGDNCGGGGGGNLENPAAMGGEDCGEEEGCPEMRIPEYTHTHHVVRYHHHVGKFCRKVS